ncbi:MAG: porin [Bacteroides sp.]
MRKLLIFTFTLLVAGPLLAQETLNTVVNTLKERITLSGYAQAGYTYNDADSPDNTFEIKRIIFMAHGKITKQWSCYFMFDFNDGGKLAELYTDYQILPGLSARLGQFKTPYSIDNQLSPSIVELINNYAQSTCYLAAVNGSDKLCASNGGRDIGLMVHGDLFDKLLTYKLAVMNGQGINRKDRNNQKDVVGYLMVNPSGWLSIGGSFIKGKGYAMADSEITGIKAETNYHRNRWSMGAVLTGKKSSLRTEFLAGKDGNVKSNGFYVIGCAQIIPKLEAIACYDYFNRNTTLEAKQSNYVAGLQYWFYPKCRVQAQYTRQEPKGGEGTNLVQAQIQVRF